MLQCCSSYIRGSCLACDRRVKQLAPGTQYTGSVLGDNLHPFAFICCHSWCVYTVFVVAGTWEVLGAFFYPALSSLSYLTRPRRKFCFFVENPVSLASSSRCMLPYQMICSHRVHQTLYKRGSFQERLYTPTENADVDRNERAKL